MTNEQNTPKVTDWLEEETKNSQPTPTGERLPPLKLEVGKIISFVVDFSNPFSKWTASDGIVKALIPVTHKMERKILWLNVKNPLYQEILKRGKAGQRIFKVSTTGTAKETRYALVEED